MKLQVFATPAELNDDDLRGCIAVVIDVLRSSSTIITALANGAREIIPVRTPAEVGELASKAGRAGSLMGGEREGKAIEGFDLGNSPRDYTREAVEGKIIFFSSSNGTGAIVRVKSADAVLVAGFNNLSSVLDYLRAHGEKVVLLCAGRAGKFSLEDFICAGSIVHGLTQGADAQVEINDAAQAALDLHRRNMNLLTDMLRRSTNGKYLSEIGFEADLGYCAQLDSHSVIPLYFEGKIRGVTASGSPLAETAVLSA